MDSVFLIAFAAANGTIAGSAGLLATLWAWIVTYARRPFVSYCTEDVMMDVSATTSSIACFAFMFHRIAPC